MPKKYINIENLSISEDFYDFINKEAIPGLNILEDAFWNELKDIAQSQGRSLNDLIADIDRRRLGNLSSALRVYVLERLRESGV